MKSTVLYHYYGYDRRSFCRSFNNKHYALTSAVYTLVNNFLKRIYIYVAIVSSIFYFKATVYETFTNFRFYFLPNIEYLNLSGAAIFLANKCEF